MTNLTCKHCGGDIEVEDKCCANCGMPLPPNLGRHPQRKFILFFIGLIIFCFAMMIWLPPDWTRFIK